MVDRLNKAERLASIAFQDIDLTLSGPCGWKMSINEGRDLSKRAAHAINHAATLTCR